MRRKRSAGTSVQSSKAASRLRMNCRDFTGMIGSRRGSRRKTAGNAEAAVGLALRLSSPAILFADHASPGGEAVGRMLLHPPRQVRRVHQAGLHRDGGKVRGGDNLLAA